MINLNSILGLVKGVALGLLSFFFYNKGKDKQKLKELDKDYKELKDLKEKAEDVQKDISALDAPSVSERLRDKYLRGKKR